MMPIPPVSITSSSPAITAAAPPPGIDKKYSLLLFTEQPYFPPRDVRLYHLQYRIPHRLLQWGVLPAPIVSFSWLITHNIPCNPVMEPPQGRPDAGGHHPHLRDKNKDLLHHGQV